MHPYLYHLGKVQTVTLLSGPKESQGSWAQIGKVHPHKCHFNRNARKSQAKGLQFEDVYSSPTQPKMGKAGARKQGREYGALVPPRMVNRRGQERKFSEAKTPHEVVRGIFQCILLHGILPFTPSSSSILVRRPSSK